MRNLRAASRPEMSSPGSGSTVEDRLEPPRRCGAQRRIQQCEDRHAGGNRGVVAEGRPRGRRNGLEFFAVLGHESLVGGDHGHAALEQRAHDRQDALDVAARLDDGVVLAGEERAGVGRHERAVGHELAPGRGVAHEHAVHGRPHARRCQRRAKAGSDAAQPDEAEAERPRRRRGNVGRGGRPRRGPREGGRFQSRVHGVSRARNARPWNPFGAVRIDHAEERGREAP
jgi:hypothetical protein